MRWALGTNKRLHTVWSVFETDYISVRTRRQRLAGGRAGAGLVRRLTVSEEPGSALFRENFREWPMLVAGVDSSTQSTKVVLCQAEDGAIVASASAPHPDGTECDPEYWWQALRQAGDGLLDQAAAVGVAAQQHGMVALDEAGQVIRPAILWYDMVG